MLFKYPNMYCVQKCFVLYSSRNTAVAVMRYSLILMFLTNVPHLHFKWICGVVVDTIVFLIHHIFIHCSNPLENRGAAEISNLNKLRLGV